MQIYLIKKCLGKHNAELKKQGKPIDKITVKVLFDQVETIAGRGTVDKRFANWTNFLKEQDRLYKIRSGAKASPFSLSFGLESLGLGHTDASISLEQRWIEGKDRLKKLIYRTGTDDSDVSPLESVASTSSTRSWMGIVTDAMDRCGCFDLCYRMTGSSRHERGGPELELAAATASNVSEDQAVSGNYRLYEDGVIA
jgi:hypothetical protein